MSLPALRRSLAVLAVLPVACVTAADDTADRAAVETRETEATTWECYSPKPGHPTTGEKTAWIEGARAAAQEAEATHGVPAADILAMTATEAGFGWTRTALEANNPFGGKWSSLEAAGGRGYYVLGCQPSWDKGNKYVKFSSTRDAILFVSSKLATMSGSWANYKAVTDRYKQDRKNCVAVVTAVNRWIDGISDAGYNYDPPTYKAKLKKIANNYMSPSTTYSEPWNLYKYSASKPSTGATWISIDAPANGATVSGTVAFQSSVGGGTVTSVKFFSRAVGAASWYALGTDTSAPYGVWWATEGWVPDGEYELKVEAWNGATKLATGVSRVTVRNP